MAYMKIGMLLIQMYLLNFTNKTNSWVIWKKVYICLTHYFAVSMWLPGTQLHCLRKTAVLPFLSSPLLRQAPPGSLRGNTNFEFLASYNAKYSLNQATWHTIFASLMKMLLVCHVYNSTLRGGGGGKLVFSPPLIIPSNLQGWIFLDYRIFVSYALVSLLIYSNSQI